MHTESYNKSLMMPLISAPEFPKYNSELSGLRNAQQKCIKWAYMHGEKNASLFAHFQLGTKKG